jgi:hypothetical protein
VKHGEHTVWLSFGSGEQGHLTHGIQQATLIRIAEPFEGSGSLLEVDAQDGIRTLLELTSPEAYSLPPGKAQNRT